MKRVPATAERATEAWKHIPLVKLGELLKQMIWFSGDYILNTTKADYESNQWIPQRASLDIQYRKRQIMIECIWETRESPYYSAEKYPDRFAIGISEPNHIDFQTQRYYVNNAIKYKHSRYYSTAIDKIEDAIYNAQEVIDDEIAEKENEEKREVELEAIKKKLCKNLDVSITKERYGNEAFAYREGNEYNFNFGSIDGTNLFQILEIGGEYTEAEIKKIIEIVGGNPRAIAERLSK